MIEPKVWIFFYGSYMNLAVLQEMNYMPEKWAVAKLSGFDIVIRPRANLIRSIVKPAKEFGFPEWYIKQLESFR